PRRGARGSAALGDGLAELHGLLVVDLGEQYLKRTLAVERHAIDRPEEFLDPRTPAGEVALLGAGGADDHHGELPAERPGADDFGVERGAEGVVPLQAEGRRVTAGDDVDRGGDRSEQHLLAGLDGGALDLLTAHAGAVGGAEIFDGDVLGRDEGEARV